MSSLPLSMLFQTNSLAEVSKLGAIQVFDFVSFRQSFKAKTRTQARLKCKPTYSNTISVLQLNQVTQGSGRILKCT